MKRILFILSISTLVLVGCKDKKNKTVEPEVNAKDLPALNADGLKIAYYVHDSLKTGYKYYAEIDSLVKNKQLAFQKELQKRESSLQNYVASNEEKANSGLLSAFDIQKVQEEIQRRQQAYFQYQETEGMKIEQETAQYLEVLTNRIEDAAKKFSIENNIDILMMQGFGSGLTYINGQMDATKAFVQFLNKYQEEFDKDLGK